MAQIKLEDLEHWKRRARRAERAQSRNMMSQTQPVIDANGAPVEAAKKRRKRTVSIRRFRVNSDGTKTLVCVYKPDRPGSAARIEARPEQPESKKTYTMLGLDIKPIDEKNSYIARLENKFS
jgi:hypothetical protein